MEGPLNKGTEETFKSFGERRERSRPETGREEVWIGWNWVGKS